ncbi:MAG TPA: hypothetical protein VGO46_01855 [Gemmatimonadaceae bacterium]|nr:hypothetical protein [Gemmatimonadaceae bacterium]
MNRVVYAFVCALVIGCGSDNTGPQDSFVGTWAGATHGINFTLFITQTGNHVSGSGNWIADSGGETDFVIDGTATPLRFTILIPGPGADERYAGSFVTVDSVAGIINSGVGDTASLSFARH